MQNYYARITLRLPEREEKSTTFLYLSNVTALTTKPYLISMPLIGLATKLLIDVVFSF